MPTYQYACTECGERLEAVQSFSDQALTECPHCHGRLRKVFNSVGVVFKGSGFYRNDSRAGNGKGSDSETKKEAAETKKEPASASSPSSSSSTSSSSSNGGSGTSGGSPSGGSPSGGSSTGGSSSSSAPAGRGTKAA